MKFVDNYKINTEYFTIKKKNSNEDKFPLVIGEVFIISKKGIIKKEFKLPNKILNGAGLMLAQFCQNETLSGLTYIAVGTGDPSWGDNPPEPDVTQTELVAEIYRKPIMVRRYLDESFNTVPGPTRIIEVEVTFMEHEANGPWREMGLFGGNATADLNSGYLFAARNFKVKNKEDDEQVSIAWRLYF